MPETSSSSLWQAAGRLGRVAAAIAVPGVGIFLAKRFGWKPPPGTLARAATLLEWLAIAALILLVVRLRKWLARRWLWSLRNRLLLTYVFIGVVPVVLLLTMGGLVAAVATIEVGAHLLMDDLTERQHALQAFTQEVLAVGMTTDRPPAMWLQAPAMQNLLGVARQRFPQLEVVAQLAGQKATAEPQGFVVADSRLWIAARAEGRLGSEMVEVVARYPVTPRLLDSLSPALGPITFVWPLTGRSAEVVHPAGSAPGEWEALRGAHIRSAGRRLPPPSGWLDLALLGVATFEGVRQTAQRDRWEPVNIIAAFSIRPSSMRRQFRGSLGEFEEPLVVGLEVIGGVFLLVEGLAVVAGVALTRTMTSAMAQLTEATAHIQAGDFSHRIPVARQDQLGALAQSFNAMAASIEALLEEQRQRQRLENELAIAREVQTQLFPQRLPVVAGFQPAAICRAARIVSGDYYDCWPLGPGRIAVAVADISGKGISAALLMANLHAALRSQLLVDRLEDGDTARLVARLHQHLWQSTPEDRYATLFFAVYEDAGRRLCYTNAGHLPPFYIHSRGVERLEVGGPVIGLLETCQFESGVVAVEPGSLLVAYSDGVTELENAYGEEFGVSRLLEEVLRHRHRSSAEIRDAVLSAAESWCAPQEFADDLTIFVARLG